MNNFIMVKSLDDEARQVKFLHISIALDRYFEMSSSIEGHVSTTVSHLLHGLSSNVSI